MVDFDPVPPPGEFPCFLLAPGSVQRQPQLSTEKIWLKALYTMLLGSNWNQPDSVYG